MPTKIEWADETWNPVAGCTKVSRGCDHCYAERMARRLAAMARADIAAGRNPGAKTYYQDVIGSNGKWTGSVRFNSGMLDELLRWRKPRVVFVNSMSDTFHPDVRDAWLDQMFAVMALCPQHRFLVLTKRPERMAEICTAAAWFGKRARFGRGNAILAEGTISHRVLPNIWLGVTVEDQAAADARLPVLAKLAVAGWNTFVSVEPLLGAVDLSRCCYRSAGLYVDWYDALRGRLLHSAPGSSGLVRNASPAGPLKWVICGGESGPGARPVHPDWVRALRDQCQAARVPFLFKQWGAYRPGHDYYLDGDDDVRERALDRKHVLITRHGTIWQVGTPGTDEQHDGQPPPGTWIMHPMSKKQAGRELDGREWDEWPKEMQIAQDE